ncbi:MAG TPA: Trm112 family protein [Pyrinomonadaceae bacterium]|nr:Trm112 family protein [Pyrinomonadaceae bacterium]
MAISQELLEILACPACKAEVELKPDGSGLKCRECKRVYPVRDDIPVMLIDEATVEKDEESAGKA